MNVSFNEQSDRFSNCNIIGNNSDAFLEPYFIAFKTDSINNIYFWWSSVFSVSIQYNYKSVDGLLYTNNVFFALIVC